MKALKLGYLLIGANRPLMDKYDCWRKTSELLQLTKRAKQKLEWFIYYYIKGKLSTSVTSRYFGITRKTFYKWFAVFEPSNLKTLEEGSRRPINTRTKQLLRLEKDRILYLRKQNPDFGKMKIERLYQRKFDHSISSWKIQLVIEKYRLQKRPKKLIGSLKNSPFLKEKP